MNRITAFLLFLLFVSCGIVDDESRVDIDPDEIALETDQSSYTAQKDSNEKLPAYSFTIVATFENKSDQTLYLATCRADLFYPVYGIELADSESSAQSGYNQFNSCIGDNEPIIISSGASRRDTLKVTGPASRDSDTNEPVGSLEGTFRLTLDVLTCPTGDGCTILDSLSWSNEFEVSLEE